MDIEKSACLDREYLNEGSESSASLVHSRSTSNFELEDSARIYQRRRPWRICITNCRTVVLAVLEILRPEFPTIEETKKLRSTAWLDGLRGVAALMVVFQHMEVAWFWEFFNQSKGPQIEAGDNWFVWILLQSPFTLIWRGGPIWVDIFFVISGYSLSYKALSLLASNNPTKVRETLASSVFRRGLRLFLPTIVSTFIAMMCVHFGIWQNLYPWWTTPPPHFDSIISQLKHWLSLAVIDPMDPFRTASGNLYDGNLWTIPVEFYGSMIVFLLLLAISSSKRYIRFIMLLGFPLLAVRAGYQNIYVFTSGIVLAEIHLLHTKYPILGFLESKNIAVQKSARNLICTVSNILWLVMAICCLVRAGMTKKNVPTGKDPMSVDADIVAIIPIMVLTVNNSSTLQAFFTTRISMFLARVSFSLYLVHGIMIRIVASSYIPFFLGLWGVVVNEEVNRFDGRKDLAYTGAMACTASVTLGASLMVADWFERGVDRKSVWFASRVFEWCEEEEVERARVP